MRLRSLALLALVAVLLAATPAAGAPPEAPILRIETGMHTAPIRSIDVDAAGRFLVTGSLDKTVRVWDLANGELLRVLRPPVGEGNEGKVYAVAITPDGDLVAAGGWTSQQGLQESIYLFDRRTGLLVRRIAGLPHRVTHLTFSPDGSRLAATLEGPNGLRIFRRADGIELFRDTEPKDSSDWADFDLAGRLVTSSADGQLRLYGPDHQRLAVREAPGGKQPRGVAFSPDGREIAVGYSGSTRVDILSGNDLRLLFSADTTGANNDLGTVAWSTDGAYLFAAGRYGSGSSPIRRWSQSGRGPYRDLPGSLDTIMDLHPLADGRLVFGSQDPSWGLLAASGERVLDQGPAQTDPRGLLDGFRIDNRGGRVRFAYEERGKRPAVFSLRDRRLMTDPVVGDRFEGILLKAPRTSAPGLQITGWWDTVEPLRNGESLPLKAHEKSRSLAISTDGQSFLLGTEWRLHVFRADGIALWSEPKPAPGVAWAVNLTADGRLALAAFGDGTIRWYRARDGAELLAFFPHSDGKRWVLWTPSGYYDSSVDGEDLIGWHANRGPDHAADFFSAWHFRDTYRRPDVIDLVLETLDEAEALRRAGIIAGAPAGPMTSPQILPPVVTILDPADDSNASTPTVKLSVNVRSPSGARVNRLLVSIDGRAVTTRDVAWHPSTTGTDARDFHEELEIPIPQHDCTIEVMAEAAGLRSEPARRRLHWFAPAPKPLRRLRVLAVGVSEYANPAYRLAYAAKDAADVAAVLKRLEGRLYDRVETRPLIDAQATQRALLEALQWLGDGLHAEDVAVIFLAGHGINDGGYYFLPYDADPRNKLLTLLSDSVLRDVLMRLPSQVLLFLDTCRAGSLLGSGLASTDQELRRLVDVRELVNLMTFSHTGVVVFSATRSGELSQESPDWGHGAFTKALLDALAGAADTNGDGDVTTSELEGYLASTVRRLTGGAQTPVAAKPGGVPDLVVALGIQR